MNKFDQLYNFCKKDQTNVNLDNRTGFSIYLTDEDWHLGFVLNKHFNFKLFPNIILFLKSEEVILFCKKFFNREITYEMIYSKDNILDEFLELNDQEKLEITMIYFS